MKKYVLAAILALIGLYFVFSRQNLISSPSQKTSEPDSPFYVTTLTIDYGNNNKIGYEIEVKDGDTAFSVLKDTLENENIYLEIIQYDFGVFVKKIGELESGAKKSWIYYVNDVSGDKAADQYTLKENDSVLWKYETPKY